MKATHKGTCQWCEAVHKVHPVKGTLANHGYKVIGGYFEGVCLGSDNKPFEQDCEIVRQSVIHSKEHLSALEKQIADLPQKATSPECYYHHYFRSYRGYLWVKVKIISSTHYELDGKQYRLHAGFPHGETLEIATLCNQQYVEGLKTHTKWLSNYIQRQSRRVQDWHVKPLLRIDGEPDYPIQLDLEE